MTKISALDARMLTKMPKLRQSIYKMIKAEARNGEPGVYINENLFNYNELYNELKNLGYDVTFFRADKENNCDRTWIWWGN